MKKTTLATVAICLFSAGINVSMAGENILNKEEAVALFTNKTFDGYNEIKGKGFKVFSSSDGTHTVVFESGKTKHRYWRVNKDGEHCVSKRAGKGGRCSVVKSVDNGVYHKITEGEHTHTLKNFVSGNQL